MHTPNLLTWTQALRTTDKPQATGKLHATSSERTGYCCLGLGCVVAEIPEEIWEYEDEDYDGEFITVTHHEFLGCEDLPPAAFHQWLGMSTIEDARDVFVDWPSGLVEYLDRNGYPLNVSCSALNDSWGLTFAQIADVLDYFGIRPY